MRVGGARDTLEARGHDVADVSEWGRDPGDEEILRAAHEQGRVLVTLDKDFAELAIVSGAPHAGIVRLVGVRAREQGSVASRVLTDHAADLEHAAIVALPGFVWVAAPGSLRSGLVKALRAWCASLRPFG